MGWSLPRDARPRRPLVGVERLRVVDERDGCRRGWRPARDARLDGRDVRRRLGGAGGLWRRRRAVRRRVPPRPPASSRSLRHRRSRRSRRPRRAPPLRSDRDPRPLPARDRRLPRGARAHRSLARRARDRLPRPGRDRRRARLAGRARALRGATRADHSDRARRVDHRHRCRRRLRAGYGSDRGGGARNRGRLGALVALLRRGRDLRADAAHAGEGPRAAPACAARLQLPPPADGRGHRPLFALGLKTTVGHAGEALDTVPAVALCGGAALYFLPRASPSPLYCRGSSGLPFVLFALGGCPV